MTTVLSDDPSVVQRILDHIDARTTDLGDGTWREPVENYRCEKRLAAELALAFRRRRVAFCPSAALAEPGSYVARDAAGTPILAVRAKDGQVRAFRNACRHRGTKLADGAGSAKAFVCRYHGWTYGLDGELRHVPHEYGFPGLDKGARGLAPLGTVERSGLVFVTQEPSPTGEAPLDELPLMVPPGHRLLGTSEIEVATNWKVFAEGFLEGYHIRSTHPETFYPVQFDNLNVVETFGPNSRIAFPYRAIQKLREVPAAERSADGKLTYVYHLFPNVMLATFPGMMIMVVIEPLTADRTRLVTYRLADQARSEGEPREAVDRASTFADAGGAEDRAVVCAIQQGLASGANEFFEFGLFEGAIVHFHRTLDSVLAGAAVSGRS